MAVHVVACVAMIVRHFVILLLVKKGWLLMGKKKEGKRECMRSFVSSFVPLVYICVCVCM
jgi:hypothetical protein